MSFRWTTGVANYCWDPFHSPISTIGRFKNRQEKWSSSSDPVLVIRC